MRGQVKEDEILDAVLETFLVSPSEGRKNIYYICFNIDEDQLPFGDIFWTLL